MSLSTLERLSVAQAAKAMQLHPFDLVRALVHLDRLPKDLRFDASELGDLKQAAGLETWFPAGRAGNPTPRGLVRDLSHQLLTRAVVGEHGTRLDNLTRGLSAEESELATTYARALVNEGVLRTWTSPIGVQVSIEEGQEYVVADLAEGGAGPDALSVLFE